MLRMPVWFMKIRSLFARRVFHHAEMFGGGKPLFSEQNAREQFRLIVNVSGRPAPYTRAIINMPDAYARSLSALPAAPPHPLNMLYPRACSDATDQLSRLLTFEPDGRLTSRLA